MDEMKLASLPLDLRALFNMQFVLLRTWCVWGGAVGAVWAAGVGRWAGE